MPRPLVFNARIQRKDPSLPRFVVIPGEKASSLDLSGTTPCEVSIDGVEVGRRNIKRWSRTSDSWFMDLNEAQCREAAVDTGDLVCLTIAVADNELPGELEALITGDAQAEKRWSGMTPSQQRMIADHVRSAKQSQTRARRARKALLG